MIDRQPCQSVRKQTAVPSAKRPAFSCRPLFKGLPAVTAGIVLAAWGVVASVALAEDRSPASGVRSPSTVGPGVESCGAPTAESSCGIAPSEGCNVFGAVAAPFRSAWQMCKCGWEQFVSGYHANRCWPSPFVECDRASVHPPFSQMVLKGWQRQNLLADPHFYRGGDQLSEAGKERVQAIVSLQPVSRRAIFVYAPDPQLAARRVTAVQQFVQTLTVDGPPPSVVPVQTPPNWASGAELDLIRRKYLESAPTPRLPAYEPLQVTSP